MSHWKNLLLLSGAYGCLATVLNNEHDGAARSPSVLDLTPIELLVQTWASKRRINAASAAPLPLTTGGGYGFCKRPTRRTLADVTLALFSIPASAKVASTNALAIHSAMLSTFGSGNPQMSFRIT